MLDLISTGETCLHSEAQHHSLEQYAYSD